MGCICGRLVHALVRNRESIPPFIPPSLPPFPSLVGLVCAYGEEFVCFPKGKEEWNQAIGMADRGSGNDFPQLVQHEGCFLALHLSVPKFAPVFAFDPRRGT